MKKIFLKILSFCLSISFLFSISACSQKNAEANLVKNSKLEDSTYALGDFMGDYTVTDINGKTHTFSEILKEKKAIVLNFWFINCGPCQMEFPYLQKAANMYSDDVAVIAINPVDEKDDDIKKYASQNNLTFPVVKGEDAWINAFSIQGFPTTIVIDRYGCVAFSHMGSITEEGLFEEIFEFFTNDKYNKTTIKMTSDFE